VACIGYEVLSVVVMKGSVFKDLIPCSPLKANRLSQALLGTCFALISCLAYSSALKMMRHVTPKRRSNFNELYDISQKINSSRVV
jgi:hypothetical protein